MRKFIQLVRGSLLLASILIPLLSARAQLVGAKVTNGSASFAQSGSTTTVTAANNTVIQYSSFNIQKGQTVQFIQPTSKSQVLNWVSGSLPTNIFGTLLGNGRVYIVNQAGVFFGPGAFVNVGALYAVAGSISTQDFLAGTNRFTANSGAVVNEGTISAHTVALIGQEVTNRGSIIAPDGFVTLAAGSDVILEEPDSAVFVTTTPPVAKPGTGVTNTGTINAAGGHALLAAGDLYSLAISQSGTVRGTSITLNGGSGTVDNSGTLDASSSVPNGIGGSVRVFGGSVILDDTSILDADGLAGGGQILVGGGLHGKDPAAPDALTTEVDAGAVMEADATGKGNGGSVVVWSNNQTDFAGQIFARGDATSGTGGSAEVSGGNLIYAGSTNLLGAPGKLGTLLLDPANITIATGGTTAAANLGFNDDSGLNDTIDPTALVAALATANIDLQAQQDITVSNAIAGLGAPGSLTLQAGQSLLINADISLGGSLYATANDSHATNASRGTGTAVLTMADNTAITASSISLNMDVGTTLGFNESGALTIGALHSTGTVSVTNSNPIGSGGIALAAGGEIETTGSVVLSAAGTGDIGAAAGAVPVYALSVSATAADGGIYLSSAGAPLILNGITAHGPIQISSDNPLTLGANIVSYNDNVSLDSPLLNIAGNMINARTVFLTAPADVAVLDLGTGVLGYHLSAADLLDISAATLSIGDASIKTLSASDLSSLSATSYNLDLTLGNSALTPTTATFAALSLGAGKTLVITGGDALNFQGALILGGLQVPSASETVALTGTGTQITSGVTFGNSGGVTIGGASGGFYIFSGGLTATAGATTLGGSVNTSSNPIDLGPTTLAADTTLSSGTNSLTLGTVTGATFNLAVTNSGLFTAGAISGVGAFTQTNPATGATIFTGIVNAGSVSLAGTTFSGSAITSTGALSITNSGPATFTGNLLSGATLSVTGNLAESGTQATGTAVSLGSLTVSGPALTVTSLSGTTTLGSVSVGASQLTLEGNALALTGGSGSVTGIGTLTIEPLAAATTIGVNGGAGTFGLTGTDVAALAAGLTVDLGQSGQTGAITVAGPVTFASNLTLEGGATGSVVLSGTLASSGTLIVQSPVTLSGAAATLSAGNALQVGAISAGTTNLTLQAATLNLNGGAGTIDGSATTPGTLTVEPASTSASIGINGAAGGLAVTGTDLSAFGTHFSQLVIGQTTDTGAVTIASGTDFALPVSILGTTGSSVVLNGNLTDAGALSIAPALSFGAGVTAATIEAGGVLTLGAVSAGTTNLTLQATSLTLNGTVSGGGTDTLTIEPPSAATSIGIGGGAGTFQVSSSALGSGFSSVTIGQNTDTGTVTVGAGASFSVPLILQGGSTSTVVLDGNLSDTGALTIVPPVSFGTGVAAATLESGGTLTLGTVTGGTTNVTLQAGALTLSGGAASVTGGGADTLTLLPATTATSIGVNGGTGTFQFSTADIGGGFSQVTLGQTTDSGAITWLGSTTFTAPFVILGGATSSLNLNGSLTDTKALTIQIPITLGGAATLGAGAGQTLTLGAITGGGSSLVLQADQLSLTGAAGAITGLGALTIVPTTLTESIGFNGGPGTLNLSSTLLGQFGTFASLTLGSSAYAGTITGTGPVSLSKPFTAIGTSTSAFDFTGALTGTGTASLTINTGTSSLTSATLTTASGPISITASTTLNTGNGTFDSGSGSLSLGTVSAGSNNLTLEGNGLALNGGPGSLTGSGVLTIEPGTAGATIGIGTTTDTLNITTADILAIAPGWASVDIGRLDGTGEIDVKASSWADPLVIMTLSGPVFLQGTVKTTTSTNGYGITIEAPVTLANDAVVQTSATAGTSGNIDFTGAINGAHSLTLDAGTGTVTVGGAIGGTTPLTTLAITTGGNLSQNGPWSLANLTLTTSGTSVTLTNSSNDFSGVVSLSSSAATDVAITSSGGLEFGNVSLTNAGSTLNALAENDNITQSTGSTLNLAGPATFTTDGFFSAITLTNAGNTFSGAVSLIGNGFDSASISSAAPLNFGNVFLDETFTVNEGGGVTQALGTTLQVSGSANFNAISSGTSINLNRAGNLFYSDVGISGNGATTVSIAASSSLDLGAISLSGGGSTLTLTAGGEIFEDGSIAVSGPSSFTTLSGGGITLSSMTNDFTGPVSLAGTGSTLVQISNNAPLQFGTVTLSDPGSTLTASANGDITQTVGGSINVGNTASFEVTAAGSNILLGNGTNLFNSFSAVNNGDVAELAVGNAATSAAIPSLPSGLTNLTLNFPNAAIDLPGLSVTNLNITSGGGDLTQSGALTVSGTTSIAVGTTHDVLLNSFYNTFNNPVGIVSARNVSILAFGNLQLTNSNLAGDLSLGSIFGEVVLSSDVTVGGTATFSGTTEIDGNLTAGTITLTGTTLLNGAGSQTLNATTGVLTVPNLTKGTGNLILEGTGGLTVNGDINVNTGNLTLTGPGGSNIGVFGTITVADGTLLVTDPITTTGSLHSIGLTLDGAAALDGVTDQAVDAGTGTLTALGNITKTGLGNLSLTGSTLNLDGTVSSTGLIAFNGPLSFSGSLSANGLTLGILTLTGTGTQTLDAGDGVLTLSGNITKNAGSLVLDGTSGININNTLMIPAGSVTVNGPSTIAGNISANGINLVGSVTLTSAGLSTLNAGAGALDVGGSITKAAGDLVLTGGGGVDLNGGASVGGALTVNGLFTVGGDATANGLTFSGAQLNGGATTLSGGAGALISNGDITKSTAGALTLSGGAVTINGSITTPDAVTFASPSTLSGNVTSQGITFLADASLIGGNQILAAGGGTFVSTGATLTKPGGDLTLTGASGQLGSITVGGTFFDNLLTSELDGTYTASSFSFANTFKIAGTTDFVGPVSLGTGFDTDGHDLTFGGSVTLTEPITVDTGGNKITFSGTLNGAEALTLDIGGGGSVSLLGNTGGIVPLASITTEGDGTLFVGGNITTNGHSQTYGTPVVIQTNAVLTELNPGGEITFNNTVDAAKAGGESLSIVSQATVTLGGLVGGTDALSTLTTDAGGLTVISGGGVTTTGAQTYGDAVQLAKTGATLTTGGGDLSVFSLDGNGQNLTLATGSGTTEIHGAVTNLGSGTGAALAFADGSTGAATFDGTVGANGALTTPAAVATVFKGNVTIAAGGAQLLGPTALDGVTFSSEGALSFGNLTLVGGAVTVASTDGGAVTLGTVDGAQSLTVTTTGTTTLGGDVGAQTALAGLSISGPATVTGNVTATGGLSFGGAVTLSGTADQTLAAGSGALSAGGTVAKSGTGALDISSGTSATLQGDVTVASGALTLDAPAITLAGNATAVGFTATHDLSLSGTSAQTIAAGTGNLSVLGVTKTSGNLALTGTGATLGGDLSAPGGSLGLTFTTVALNTDVKLSSGGGDLTVAGTFSGSHAVDLESGSGDVDAGTASFGSATGALTTFTANGGSVTVGDVYTSGNQIYTAASKGVLFLDGSTYQATSGNVDLNSTGSPLTSIPDVATIVKANVGDLTIDAGGNFSMGVFQKLSVLGGNLLVDTNGTATLSDMSVAGTLTVKAAKYSLLIRAPGNVLVSTGEATDLGLDFVSFSAALEDPTGTVISGANVGFNTASGSSNYTVRFATADGKATVPAYPGFSFYTLPSSYFSGELITSLLFGPLDNAYLSLRAIGFVRANVDSALPPAAPAAPVEVVTTYVVPAALRDDLVKLGIFARPDEDLVLQPFDPDAPIYDATIKSDDRSPERFEVADSRISSQNVLAAIRLYRQIFEERTPDGRTRSRIDEIQRVLATAYASYHRETGSADPDGFRRYLEKNGGAALTYLNQLRDLVAKIGQVGLTPNEFSISKTYVLRSIRIPGMSLKALREAVAPEGPSDSGSQVTASLFKR